MASAPPLLANRASAHGGADFRRALVGVVDSVSETRGIGVVLIEPGRLHRLRTPDPGEATVVFELRDRPRGIPFIQKGAASAGRPAAPVAAYPARNAGTSPATEWINLGLNCGGAVLARRGAASRSAGRCDAG